MSVMNWIMRGRGGFEIRSYWRVSWIEGGGCIGTRGLMGSGWHTFGEE
jgi:hypothetical protein